MSRSKDQKVIDSVTVSTANLPFAARVVQLVTAKGFDPVKDKDKVMGAATAERDAAKAELDAANTRYLGADQKCRIGDRILFAAVMGKGDSIDAWKTATKEVKPAKD